MKTICCNYESSSNVPYPVFWNEFNKVVQCHNCGEIYVPVSQVHTAFQQGRQDCMKWVGEECKKNLERLTAIRDNLHSPLDDN